MCRTKILISLYILLVLGLQVLPFLHDQGEHQTLWPFLKWNMYDVSFRPGLIHAERCRITGITLKGQKKMVTSKMLGLSQFVFEGMYIVPMKNGNSSVAHRLLTQLNTGLTDPFVELHLEIRTYALTDAGLVTKDLPVEIYRGDLRP